MNVKIAEAVTLAKIAGSEAVDRAWGDAGLHGRFAHGDLASILNSNIRRTTTYAANEASSRVWCNDARSRGMGSRG